MPLGVLISRCLNGGAMYEMCYKHSQHEDVFDSGSDEYLRDIEADRIDNLRFLADAEHRH